MNKISISNKDSFKERQMYNGWNTKWRETEILVTTPQIHCHCIEYHNGILCLNIAFFPPLLLLLF